MPGITSRFKIKSGDIEVEFEGLTEEVSARFKETFEWLKAQPITKQVKSKTEFEAEVAPKITTKGDKMGKTDGRGGSRSKVISPAIDKMIADGFFDSFKNPEQVKEELKRIAVPITPNSVEMALKRKVPKTLDRMKDTEQGWVYRKKS